MIDDSLEVIGESIEAREFRTRLSVEVRVNDQGPFRFIVDSGADRSVIGSGLAERLGLPPGPMVRLVSMAGVSTVGTVRIDTLAIGTSEIPNLVAPALPEANLGAQGLLGIDALADQRLMLDFDQKTITVQDSRMPQPQVPGEIVVTARLYRGQLILTQANVGKIRTYAIIDTGAEVTLGNSALRARVFGRRKPPPVQMVTLTSVTGQQITGEMIRLPEFKVGDLLMRNVPVVFLDVPPFALFGLTEQPGMLLGTDVLEAFHRVSLDFRKRRVRFQLRR